MPRTKKIKSLKEPVTVRFRDLANGSKSIYLDIYHKGRRSYEFLKMYLLPETSEAVKQQNAAILRAANTIKSQRVIMLANNEAGLKNTSVHAKMLLLDWMDTYYQSCEKRGRKGNHQIQNAIKIFKTYRPKTRIGQVDREFCLSLKEHLCNGYRTKSGATLSDYSVINYMAVLRAALNEAVRADIIPDNPLMKLSVAEKVKAPVSQREYLSIDEVQRLIDTDCKHGIVKSAFLFSCNCGLRLSDVKKLRWGEIQTDGDKWRANIIMFKTQTPLYLPLSKNARRWMPERESDDADELVFKGMLSDHYGNRVLRKWMKEAGIAKHVSYHVSRHTFATMMLTLGADLYTVSKLLGHTKIETTQIYGKIINQKKEDAISMLDSAFD